MRNSICAIFVGLTLTLSGCEPTPEAPRVNQGVLPKARDERPLLTLMAQFSDEPFKAHHTPSYFESMLFTGESYPNNMNIHGYFYEVSLGEFSYVNAGIIGPITLNDNPSTPNVDESRRDCSFGDATTCPGTTQNDSKLRTRVIAQAASEFGFDYSIYDKNNNDLIEEHELTILVIDSGPVTNPWGGSRYQANGCETVPRVGNSKSVKVCGLIPGMTENASFATAAHEIAHTLGAIDLYGPNCMGYRQTLMSCTVIFTPDLPHSVYLDPWHRTEFGWQVPRIIELDDSGIHGVRQAEFVLSADPGGPIDERPFGIQPQPVLIKIKGDSINRFLLLEYRNWNAGMSPYDKDATVGLNIWYVELNSQGYPIVRTNDLGAYNTVFVLPGLDWKKEVITYPSQLKPEALQYLELLKSTYGFELGLAPQSLPFDTTMPEVSMILKTSVSAILY